MKKFKQLMLLYLGLRVTSAAKQLACTPIEELPQAITKAQQLLKNANPSSDGLDHLLFFSHPVNALLYEISFATNHFNLAYQAALDLDKALDLFYQGSTEMNRPKDKILSYLLIDRFQVKTRLAVCLLASAGYSSVPDEQKIKQLELADQVLHQAMTLLQQNPTLSSQERNRSLSRIHGHLAHLCHLQGKDPEAKEWLIQMITHGGVVQIKESMDFVQRLQQQTQQSCGFISFMENHTQMTVAQVTERSIPRLTWMR